MKEDDTMDKIGSLYQFIQVGCDKRLYSIGFLSALNVAETRAFYEAVESYVSEFNLSDSACSQVLLKIRFAICCDNNHFQIGSQGYYTTEIFEYENDKATVFELVLKPHEQSKEVVVLSMQEADEINP